MTRQAPEHNESASADKKAASYPWVLRGGFFLAGMVVLLTCGQLLFQTSWAQQTIQSKINAALPGAITWELGRISLLERSLEIRHVQLLDPEQKTVASFDRLMAHFNLSALLRRTIDIAAMVIESPRLDLTTTPSGLNINRVFLAPEPRLVDQSGKTAAPFSWVVRSMHIRNGQFDFSDPIEQLNLRVASIELTGRVSVPEQNGSADLTIGSMEIQSPRFSRHFAPLKLSAQLENGQLAPLSVSIHSDRSQLTLNGGVNDLLTDPHLDLTVDAQLELAEIKPLLPVDADINGRLAAQMEVQGSWANPRVALALAFDGGTLFDHDYEEFLINLTMVNRVVTVDNTRFSLPGGTFHLAGNIDLSPLFPQDILHYEGNLAELAYDLTLEGSAFHLASLFAPDMEIAGTADGRLKISGRGLDPLHGRAEVIANMDARQIISPRLEHPLDAQITLTGLLENGTATWSGLHAHTEAFDITSQGRLHLDSRSIDGTLAVNLPDLSRALAPLGMDAYQGNLALDTSLSGFVHAPEIELKLTGQGLQMESHRFGDLFITGRFADDLLTVKELRLRNNTSEIDLEGSIRLKDRQTGAWTSNPVVALTVQKASIELRDFFSDLQGHLDLDGDVAGTVQSPTGLLQLKGQDIDLGGQAIDSVDGAVHLENGNVMVDALTIHLPHSAPVTVKGRYHFDGTYTVDITGKGVDLGAISAVKDQALVQGLLDLQLSGQGSVIKPQLNGILRLRQLHINGNPGDDVDLTLALQDGTARIDGDLGFALSGAYTLAPGDFTLSAQLKETDLSPYFTLFNHDRLGGLLTGHISAQGTVGRMAEMTAQVGLTDVQLTYDGQAIIKSGRVNLALAEGEATLSQTALELLNKGFLHAEGKIDAAEKLDVRVRGALPAQAMQLWQTEPLGLSGTIGLDAQVTGTLGAPVYEANIALSEIGGTIPYLKQKLHNMNGGIRINADSLEVNDLEGFLDDGSFRLSGVVDWVRFEPRQVDLGLEVKKLPVTIPEMLQARIDGKLRFRGQPRNSRLSGMLVIHDGLYYQDVNLQEMVISQGSSQSAQQSADRQPAFMGWENIGLDIVLKRGGLFRVENNLSEMDIDFDLHFQGHLDRPAVAGRAQVLSGEIYFPVLSVGALAQTRWIPAGTQTFEVQQGVIDFINPSRIEPHLDIRGQVSIRHWIVYLDISGTPQALEFDLSSQPSESEADIVSLLLTGRTASEMAGEGQAAGISNEQRLMEFMASTFQDDIKALTGLDVIETGSTSVDGQNGEASVTVTVGKKLSERLTLKYATESRGADIINSVIAEYRILENIRALGFQNTAGNFGGSLNFRHEFR